MKRSLLRFAQLLALLAAFLVAEEAHAQVNLCGLSSTVDLAFGSYDPFSATPLDTMGSVSYTCLGLINFVPVVTIDISTGSSGAYSPWRTMKQGAYVLNYNLYTNAARTQLWGNGANGTYHYGPVFPGLLNTVVVNIYGRVPAGQSARIGSYAETLVITLNF